MDQYLKLKASFEAAGITWYYSEESALAAWMKQYLPLSKEHEHVTFLYSIDTPLGTRYYTTQTICGTKEGPIFSANVIVGTIALAVQDSISYANLIAHVHTHPDPGVGYHNDFPSASPDIYGGDRIVFELLNLPEMYVIPYQRCKDTPAIIVYSDRSTWCPHYQE